jgi:YidC/Oxa1 family membrane protein insertase
MSSPTPPNSGPKELSSELRMLLAFGLMGAILIGSNWIYHKFGLIPADTPQTSQSKTSSASKAAPLPGAQGSLPGQTTTATDQAAAAPQGSDTAPIAQAANKQTWFVDTDVYHVVFSNQGAVVESWTLKKYPDEFGKPLELVNQRGALKTAFPLTLQFRGEENAPLTAALSKAYWEWHPRGDGLSIEYDYSDGHTVAKKVISFSPNSYLVQFADEVTRDGKGVPHQVSWRAGFGDMGVNNPYSHQSEIRYDLKDDKLVRDVAKSAKNGALYTDGSFSFFGVEDQYFTATFLPPIDSTLKTTLFDDTVPTAFTGSEEAYPGIAAGGEARNQMGLFVGPKEGDIMEKVNPNLSHVIDWGWFRIIAQPLFIMLRELHNKFIHNYGWSIIVLTLFINLALFPLKIMNLKSMRKMQVLQPQIAKINDKYKGIGMSDPRSQQKQAEIMELYKQHGVNPMGGCLPMMIQLPFLIAFYKVLSVSVEMRHAQWLWVADLTQPEHFGIHFLPLIMIVTSILLQKMTPTPAGGDPSQQKMMQFMPVMMGIFFWSLSSGVVLYYLTSNLVGVAQQWFFNKTAPPIPSGGAKGPVKTITSKDGRKKA